MYNSENTIKQCIDSIELQRTRFTYSILVVDDGSTDSSVSIVDGMIGIYKNITLLRQKNMKQAEARNYGLRHSRGKYVLFIDSDDTLHLDMIEKMLIKAYSGSQLVVCDINKIYSDKIIEEKSKLFKRNFKNKIEFLSHFLTKNKELDVGLWNKIFDLDIIKQKKIKFENGNFFEDSLFVLRYLTLCSTGKVTYVNEPLYNLFRNQSSTTTSLDSKIDSRAIKYIDEVSKILREANYVLTEQSMNAFKIRTWMYIVHHHIKYDSEWDAQRQGETLSFISGVQYMRGCINLDITHMLGALVARYCPSFYQILYRRKK